MITIQCKYWEKSEIVSKNRQNLNNKHQTPIQIIPNVSNAHFTIWIWITFNWILWHGN